MICFVRIVKRAHNQPQQDLARPAWLAGLRARQAWPNREGEGL